MIEKSKHYALAIACGAKRGPKDSDLTFSPASLRDFLKALDQPEQEPVAEVKLMMTGGNAGIATRIVEIDDPTRERLRPGQKLYTAPPQRKPEQEHVIDCPRCGHCCPQQLVQEPVAAWMIQRGYATGHGDTTEDLLKELEWQIAENWTSALVKGVEGEREACAGLLEENAMACENPIYRSLLQANAAAIRARGNA